MAGLFDFFRRRGTGPGQTSAVRDMALREIKRTWSAEDADIREHEKGFDWLPGSHEVQVRIVADKQGDDPSRHRIAIATRFLATVPVHEQAFVSASGAMAHTICPTFAPVYRPSGVDDARSDMPADLLFFSSAYVDEGTAPWLAGLLARLSAMQFAIAERFSGSTAEQLGGGTPAFAIGSRFPTDHMVFQVEKLLRMEGEAPSSWNDSWEFEDFAELHGQSEMCFGTAGDDGMTLETPFGSDSALIRFKTDSPYPPLGNGLLVETWIRSGVAKEDICSKAALLNYFEAVEWTDFPQLGRWHPHSVSADQTVLAHSSFIPNMFFADGLVTNYALWAIARAQWARIVLLPDTKNLTMREILEARFGK